MGAACAGLPKQSDDVLSSSSFDERPLPRDNGGNAWIGEDALSDPNIQVLAELQGFVWGVEARRRIRLPKGPDLIGKPLVAEQSPSKWQQAQQLAQPKAGNQLRGQLDAWVLRKSVKLCPLLR